MTHSVEAPSQVELRHVGPHGLVIAQVSREGAAIDGLSVGGVELIQRWDNRQPRPYSAGLILAPWPNRIRDGRWRDGQSVYDLDITEPSRNNAIHGLVARTLFNVVEHTESSVGLECDISPSPGYPFTLRVSIRYVLGDQGIECSMWVVNLGESAAPVALGAHPYITLGETPIRSLTISAPVTSHLVTDEQMIPVGEEEISGSDVDISSPVSLESLSLDTGFRLKGAAPYTTTLEAPNGKKVAIWQSEEFGWLQVFVTDAFPGQDGPTSALAIEPMTAPADAFNSGVDLTWLQPQEKWGGSWGITLHI